MIIDSAVVSTEENENNKGKRLCSVPYANSPETIHKVTEVKRQMSYIELVLRNVQVASACLVVAHSINQSPQLPPHYAPLFRVTCQCFSAEGGVDT